MLYSHLQFLVHERRGRHRTRFVFFELFSYFSVVGDVPTPANFARQFWYENTLKFIRILRQVYAEYAVDWHRGLAISFWNTVRQKSSFKRVRVFYGALSGKFVKNKNHTN